MTDRGSHVIIEAEVTKEGIEWVKNGTVLTVGTNSVDASE